MTETIPGLLRDAAARYGAKSALVSPGMPPVSFAELDAMTDRFAKALLHDGMAEGERTAIWLANAPEWIAAAVGTQRVGGVMIPLFFRYRGSEVADILKRASVSRLVCSPDLAEQLQGQGLPALRRVILVGGSRGSGLREIGWDHFLAGAEEVSNEDLHRREAGLSGDHISDIMFTSGTTGIPKGGVFTHRSAVAAARIMQHYNGASEADCFCPMGSFAHIGGYKQGWLTGLASGATIAWGDMADSTAVLNLVGALGITIMPAAPITWQSVLDDPQRDGRIATLRFVATGGTMIPEALVRRLNRELGGAQVGTGYGMTETCGMAAYTRPDDPPDKVASTVGRAAPDTELRIVGPDGRDLPEGETGEILIRNPRLLIEYLDDPEATRAALDENGWFHSGDVGKLDGEGYLTITDRLKDMYIINGLNVYPAEIERALETIDGVGQCAVVGVPEGIRGEVGAAFIVRAPGSALDAAGVAAWCRDNLARYKVPKFITFVDSLPRNAMGKVLKNELRQMQKGAEP